MNYRTRLTLLTCVAIAVTLVAASFVAYSLARNEAFQQIDDALQARIALTRAFQKADEARREYDREHGIQHPSDNGGPRIPGLQPGAAGGFTRVLDATGKEVEQEQPPKPPREADRPQPPRIDPSDLPRSARDQFRQIDVELPITAGAKAIATSSGRRVHLETVKVDGSRYRVVTGRVGGTYTVQVARPIDETEDFLDHLALLLGLVTLGGIAIGVAAALLVTGAASRPVQHLTELTAAVRESGDLSKRVEVTSNDDLGRLAHSVNSMLEELERASVRQQQLVDDASHQLRTPLASIRTNMDVLLRARSLDEQITREILQDLSAQTDELTGLVRDLVDLASSVESDVERDPVRLDAAAEEAVRRVRSAFDTITFETDVHPVTVHGSEERIVRMIQNLLHNAGKWSAAGDTVTVQVAGREIRVVDHGPGVAEEEKTRIFERFHRAADARDVPGSGLGLAIVQQVAIDHGGMARVVDTPGGGATFIVRLPLGED